MLRLSYRNPFEGGGVGYHWRGVEFYLAVTFRERYVRSQAHPPTCFEMVFNESKHAVLDCLLATRAFSLPRLTLPAPTAPPTVARAFQQ